MHGRLLCASDAQGQETVGTDAGAAHSFDPPFPCHAFFLGAGKYGLTQLQNLARLPATGSVLIAAPLPIAGGPDLLSVDSHGQRDTGCPRRCLEQI